MAEYASAEAHKPTRSLPGPVAPPAELVVVAQRLLPPELHERAEQAQLDLRLPPAVGVDRRGPRASRGARRSTSSFDSGRRARLSDRYHARSWAIGPMPG